MMDRAERIDATNLLDDPLPAEGWRGPYPGTVVSTVDPLKRGRVRVRAPQVYGDPEQEDEFVPDDALPWARPTLPCHDYHAGYAVGDGVWITFWGADSDARSAAEPILMGQWLGEGDSAPDVPDEFVSSYSPDPRTRLIRTLNGHSIEMRWVDGEERVTIKTAGGSSYEMADLGPSITLETPGQRKVTLDDAAQSATLETPTQTVRLDDVTQTISILTPGQVIVTAGGTATIQAAGVNVSSTGGAPTNILGSGVENKTFVGNAVHQYLGYAVTALAAVAIGAATTLALTATGVMTLIGVSIVLASAAVQLGSGPYRTLVDSRWFAFYDAHVHAGPGVAPTVLSVPVQTTLSTQDTTAS